MIPRCTDPSDLYRPQWPYAEPDDARDEVFVVGPFSMVIDGTGLLTQSVPVQLDDDVDYYIRSIKLQTQVGTTGGQGTGMLVRLRDPYGNPLCAGGSSTAAPIPLIQNADLALGLGVWANQEDGLNAWAWVMEPEIACPPGGTLLFDFQAQSTGNSAKISLTVAGEVIQFTAAIFGAAGNGSGSIELINPGAANVPLSIAVVGTAVRVTLQTNGASAIISTFEQVANLVNSTPAALAIMFAVILGPDPATVITALATSAFGTGPIPGRNGSPITVEGSFYGVKRFRRCL
jgi:hypothetical protein